jgi:Zn finger protein HypA/HybF involved in hydrogenase expression
MTKEFAIALLKQDIQNSKLNISYYHNDVGIEALELAIKALEQESKMGHWIKVRNGRGGHECDLCHEYAPSYQSGKEYLTKRCPNCGAKMESEEVE